MNDTEKRQLDNMLISMGLKDGLSDPALYQRLADLISDWPGDKNQFFVDLLAECDGDKRYDMYSAMGPRLRFKPMSFIECETSIQMRANELISQKRMRVEGKAPRAINIGNQVPEPKAIMRCWCCKKQSKFAGETPVAAVTRARKAGWLRTVGFDLETCPKCVKRGKTPDAKQALAMGIA